MSKHLGGGYVLFNEFHNCRTVCYSHLYTAMPLVRDTGLRYIIVKSTAQVVVMFPMKCNLF